MQDEIGSGRTERQKDDFPPDPIAQEKAGQATAHSDLPPQAPKVPVLDSHNLEEVVHRCLLHEVFLLLDFISSRPEPTLACLGGIIDPDTNQPMTFTGVLKYLNRVRYPPAGTVADRARDATVLQEARDRLNKLARPANGLSVAYTTMFAGGARFHNDWWGSRLAAQVRRSPRLGWIIGPGTVDPATRYTLAARAFPGLVTSAKRFRFVLVGLMVAAIVVTLFSVWVSYQVALGRALMLRFDALDRQKTDISTRIYAAEHEMTAKSGGQAPRLCDDQGGKPQTVEQQQLCDANDDWRRKNDLAYRDLSNYAHQWGMRVLTPRPAPGVSVSDSGTQGDVEDGESEQLAASVLSAFSTSVLPVQFGLLGIVAAVVRSIYGHVQQRTLTPREMHLTIIRLPLGLLAGVSVGLLFSPSTAPIQGGAGLAGGLILSASGVAFLAGYGVEAVFGLFDALLQRIFALNMSWPGPPPSPASGQAIGVTTAGPPKSEAPT